VWWAVNDRTLPARSPNASLAAGITPPYELAAHADIVALQEALTGPRRAQAFPGHDFCFSARAHTQNGCDSPRPVNAASPNTSRLVDNAVRRGAVVTFFPDR
jgi:hypothetical protein